MGKYEIVCLIVFIVFLIIAVVSVFLPLFFIGNRTLISFQGDIDNSLMQRIDYIVNKRNFFLKNSVCWMMCFYALSILAACCNILVIFCALMQRIQM